MAYGLLLSASVFFSACTSNNSRSIKVYETSAHGQNLQEVNELSNKAATCQLVINSNKKYQTITGFGGSFTESSASLLNGLSPEKRQEVLRAYFGDEGAQYSLTRTHMNSCDFSLSNYSYAPIEDDTQLEHFSIKEDMDDIIPMILDAQKISTDGFRIISSPWTAPPWMKDNKDWRGGKLLPQYYDTWALFFSKYINAYHKEGIDIWGITVENEPLGNANNWESMHYSPQEMTDFVTTHLGPRLEQDGHDVVLLGYDQNRGDELKHWVDNMFATEAGRKYFDGTAVHWYASTFDYFPESLQYAHDAAPNKYLIQTEACVDSEVPKWNDDAWYWTKEATDWGWDWAPEDQKYLHPKYKPAYRYARDIIGCLNNWVDGWVDWNMVLDKQGGPNWFKNWCAAPVLVDTDSDDIYYTPLYYIMCHFSKFIRPGAKVIDAQLSHKELMSTAAINPDGSMTCVIFNPTETTEIVEIKIDDEAYRIEIAGQTLQTISIKK